MSATEKPQSGHSRVFYDYVKSIGECKSKQEEDSIVEKDLKDLKATLARPHVDDKTAKECVMRVVYAEMLGHSAEFGYIHCVNLTSSSDLLVKRTGYLATGLCVDPDDDLMYLIVANIQRDMKSSNFLEVAAAASAAARLLRTELVLALSADLAVLLKHPKPLVRRKAVEAMHAFYIRSHGEVGDVHDFRQALTDRDPSVMDAAVRLLYDVVRDDAASQRDLLDAFLSILSQVAQRRLVREYDHHNVPAPWLQIRILRLLALLVGQDAALARRCEPLLVEVMRRADSGRAIGFAIIAEMVAAAAAMPPLEELLTLCAGAIEGFLGSSSPNVRYMGVKMLSQVASRYPALAAKHQSVIMQCLEDPDETIRRRTITLLFAICNSENVEPITHRVTQFLSRATMQSAAVQKDGRPVESGLSDSSAGSADAHLKRSITHGLCLVAERFAPSALWYVQAMNRVMMVAAECVPYTVVQRVLKLIAEGQDGVSDSANTLFRTECVEAYFALTGGDASPGDKSQLPFGGSAGGGRRSHGDSDTARRPAQASGSEKDHALRAAVPDLLQRVAAWVLGEYGYLTKRISPAMLMDRLCDMLERADDGNGAETRSWIVTAMTKLAAARGGVVPDDVVELVRKFQDSHSVGLQQRCYEFTELLRLSAASSSGPSSSSASCLVRRVLPLDGCCEDLQVDASVSFLNSIVETALQRGAKPYDAARSRTVHSRAAGTEGRGSELLPTNAYQPQQSALGPTGPQPSANMTAVSRGLGVSGGAPGSVDFEKLQATDGVLPEEALRVRHGARRWGMKDLEAPPPLPSPSQQQSLAPEQPGAMATVGGAPAAPALQSAALASGARHADPVVLAGAAAGKGGPSAGSARPDKNAKFMKDIFGRVGAGSGSSSSTADNAGLWGDSSRAKSTANERDGTATNARRPHDVAAQRSAATNVMDDLFAPTPPVPSQTLAPAAGPLSSPGGEKTDGLREQAGPQATRARWGPTTSAPAPASAGLPSGTVRVEASRAADAEGRTYFRFTVSLAGPLSTQAAVLGLKSSTGVSLRVLRVDGQAYSAESTLGAAAHTASPSSVPLRALSAAHSVSVDATLVVSSAPEFLRSLARGESALTVAVTTAPGTANDVDSLLFSRPAPPVPQAVEGQAGILATTGLQLALSDAMHPVNENFATAAFGQAWVATAGETKASLQSTSITLRNSAALRACLSRAAKLHVVEIIDTEWIAASVFSAGLREHAAGEPAQREDTVTVLCHLAVTGERTAQLTVRCGNDTLRQAVAAAVQDSM